MPPQLEHGWVLTTRRHRVDAARRVIHALNAQRVLIFMNFQRRLQASPRNPKTLNPYHCAWCVIPGRKQLGVRALIFLIPPKTVTLVVSTIATFTGIHFRFSGSFPLEFLLIQSMSHATQSQEGISQFRDCMSRGGVTEGGEGIATPLPHPDC